MKRIAAIFIILTFFINATAFAGREYLLKYAYPENVRRLSIYDLLGKPKGISKKDKIPPKVFSTHPENKAVNVKINSTVRIKFNENIKKGKYFNTILVKQGNKNIKYSASIIKNELVLKADLSPNSSYTIYLPKSSIIDYAGNSFLGYSFSFKTEVLVAKKKQDFEVFLSKPFSLIFPLNDFSSKEFNYNSSGEYLFFEDIEKIQDLEYVMFEDDIPYIIENNKKIFNPLAAVECALQEFSYYKSGKIDAFLRAKKIADYLILKQESDGSFVNDFSYKEDEIEIKGKWKSALTQGMAISLFIRIYKETQNTKYLDAAKKSLIPLLKQVNEGGACSIYNGKVFYDMLYQPSKYTLSSHMFVLFGLYDLSEYDERAKGMFYGGVETLKEALPDMFENDRFYENVQIAQIKALNSILKDPFLSDFLVEPELIEIE